MWEIWADSTLKTTAAYGTHPTTLFRVARGVLSTLNLVY